jgi:exopolysaccharide biosynthesis polyprenyl glycosylphosphotransferase
MVQRTEVRAVPPGGKEATLQPSHNRFEAAYTETATVGSAAGRHAPVLWGESRSRGRLLQPGAAWVATSIAVDLAMLAIATVLVLIPRPGAPSQALGWTVLFCGLTLALMWARGAYRSRLRLQITEELRWLVGATATAAMALITLRALVTTDPDGAADTAHFWVFATLCLAVGRASLVSAQVRARRNGRANIPTLIVGAGRLGHLTAKRLQDTPELGLRPIGFLDKEPLGPGEGAVRLPVLGASWDLERVISQHEVEHVIVSFSTAPHQVLLGMVRRCRELRVSVSVLPRLFEVEGERVTVERLGALPLVTVHASDPKGWRFQVKYAVDRVIGSFLLLVSAPLLLAAVLAIRVTMGKPIFYRQRRVGHDGHEFDMLKFRTMSGVPEEAGEADAGWALQQLDSGGTADGVEEHDESHGPTPDRRTPLGRVLRHFSLDELPQLWNVVRGDMSLVGPRPERVSYVRRFEHAVYRYGERHRVKSGITGWAQVHGLRGKTSLADRVEWDNYYIENWSWWLDVKIILMTVACVLQGQHEEPEES